MDRLRRLVCLMVDRPFLVDLPFLVARPYLEDLPFLVARPYLEDLPCLVDRPYLVGRLLVGFEERTMSCQ